MTISFRDGIGFEWRTEQGDLILLKYEFPEPALQIEPTDNIVLELWANDHVESQVYPITFDSGATCGWLCTVSALTSKELHVEWRENKFFRITAWAVVRYLVDKYQAKLESNAIKTNRYEFNLNECIDEELSIITFYRPNAPQSIQMNSNLLIPKFLEMGLIPFVNENSKTVSRPKFKLDAKVLNISTNIPSHHFQDFYNDLLTRYIPSVNDITFKFYLYYQIIESMMEDILVDVAKVVLGDLTNAQGNVVAIRDSLEKYQKISSETSRIKRVFSVLPPASYINLRENCVAFLEAIDTTFSREDHVAEDVAFFVYKARNQLVHNFRRTQVGRTQLEQIICCFEDLIPGLICKFGAARPT